MRNNRARTAGAGLLLWMMVSIVAPGTSMAQEAVADSARARGSVAIGDTIVADIVAVGVDAVRLFARPAGFDGVDWAVVGGATALGLGLMPLDDELRDAALSTRGTDGDEVAEVANSFGTWLPPIAVAGGLYLGGLAFDAPRVRLAGRHVAQSVVYAALVTTTLKVVAGRQRPLFGEGQYVADPFTTDDRYHSLASGHTTLAFAVASSLAADIDHLAATVALYGAATMTGLARMYVDRHWASDVVLGAAIGAACGYGVAHLDDASGREGSSLLVVPAPDRLTLVWTF